MSKNLRVGVGLFVFGSLIFSAFADSKLPASQELQQAIRAKNATWVAKDNWVTQLPREQIKRMMGVQKAPDLNAEFIIPQGSLREFKKLPSSLDWRNKNGVNWVSPILNQGNCGSCVAFSTVATLETQMNISSGIPGMNPQFSTQALFTCGGGACDFGWQPELAAQYLKKSGVPDEACDPDTESATGADVDCSAACADHDARSLKIANYTTPTTGSKNIDAVKAALQNGPLTTTLMVYDDFLFYSGGVYKHVSGDMAGGHAVSIVGYNDADRAWIVRNSWGKEWGENGFVRVSYDDTSGISNETWHYEVPKADGYVTLENPRNRVFLSGAANLHAESTFANTQKVSVTVTNAQGRSVYSASCATKVCTLNLDTTKLADGIYDAIAIATVGSRVENSQHEMFFVINGTATMSLSFTGGQGEDGSTTDLTKPLVGRVVFNVNAQSTPVPFSGLAFHVKKGGKEVYTKSSSIIVPGMTMGWRTGSVPNGSYEIYFTGQIAPQGRPANTVESQHMTVTVQN